MHGIPKYRRRSIIGCRDDAGINHGIPRVVDDDDSIRWVLDKALSKAGYSTVAYTSADDALKHLDGALPEVIVSDIRMPGTSGLGLLDSLKKSREDISGLIKKIEEVEDAK